MLYYPLKNKVVILTGASMGLGRALAVALGKRGARLVLAARSIEKLYRLQIELESYHVESLVSPTDMHSPITIDQLVDNAITRWGQIDVVVNNAGYGLWGFAENLPMQEVQNLFQTNLFGPLQLMQRVIPHMKKRKTGQIVNIESVVALRSMPGSSAYCATKHALHAFSESLRTELAPHGIHVCSVCPGLVTTEFGHNKIEVGFHTEFPSRFSMTAEKAAEKIARAMQWRRRQIVIPVHAKFMYALQRLSPTLIDWVMRIGQVLGIPPLGGPKPPGSEGAPPA
ncbi:MAG: SDR family NAD(P)-dependent oxidoreductase [Verrucomicrobiae bacterium]|nr:SDR family NAD(P)-dependent oxidoreductase [Verrucomicrobiae bacterium]